MKKRLLFTALCLLVATSIPILISTKAKQNSTPQQSQSTKTQALNYRISGPYTHKNLSVFLVHGKDLLKGHSFLTLQEALSQKKVIVYETKDVNELAIQNLSNQDVFVQSGDIVRGGDQDRMISTDFIVPPQSGRMPIAAFCVEAGRWSRRGSEANTSFASSENSASTRELKLAAKRSNSQQAVWENVSVAQEKLSRNVGASVNSVVSRSSLELSVEDPKVKETSAAYVKALSEILQGQTDVIGYAFAINGQVNSADIYASRALFLKLWPKLLKASAIEAIAKFEAEQESSGIDQSTIQAFLADSEQPQAGEREVTGRVTVLTRENDRNIFFETRDRQDGDGWIHRNYIRKN